jgi:hypothetical protein
MPGAPLLIKSNSMVGPCVAQMTVKYEGCISLFRCLWRRGISWFDRFLINLLFVGGLIDWNLVELTAA